MPKFPASVFLLAALYRITLHGILDSYKTLRTHYIIPPMKKLNVEKLLRLYFSSVFTVSLVIVAAIPYSNNQKHSFTDIDDSAQGGKFPLKNCFSVIFSVPQSFYEFLIVSKWQILKSEWKIFSTWKPISWLPNALEVLLLLSQGLKL